MRKIIAFWAFIIIALEGNAQRHFFQAGVFVSPQLSYLYNQTDIDQPEDTLALKATGGMGIGLIGGYTFSPHFSLFVNAIYSSQGQIYNYKHLNYTNGVESANIDLRHRLFKFPFLIQFGSSMEKNVAFQMYLGPQIELLASVKEQKSDTRYQPFPPYFYQYTNYPNRKDTYNTVNYSAVFGFSFEVKLRYNVRMNAGIRASYMLNDIEDKEEWFYRTRDGVDEKVKYYSKINEARFGQSRTESKYILLGANIGLSYWFIPDTDLYQNRK